MRQSNDIRAHVFTKKHALLATAAFVLACALYLLYGAWRTAQTLPPPADALYRRADVSTAERIADILSYMTIEEKAAQLALVEKNSIHDIEDIARYGIGALLSGAGAKPDDAGPEGWRAMIDAYEDAALRSRVGIPLLYGVDAVHGHGNVQGATIFPHQIALGAADDEDLVEAIGRATARELLATGVRWNFAPSLDLPSDIRWGRVYEAFSDDPARAGRLGAAYVRGLQEPHGVMSDGIGVLATPKHFIGLGAMTWGSSRNKDFRMDQGVTAMDPARLESEWLPPFRDALGADARVVMAGLNAYGTTDIAGNKPLLSDILKGELGFKGFVVSDWYGVYELPGGEYRAAVTALNAGVDMVMLPFDYQTFIRNVSRAVRRGEISEERLDDAVSRVLAAKFALGLFDAPGPQVPASTVGTDAHRALARTAAARSLVVLKNEDGLLPLSRTADIRVAGSAADNTGLQAGAWTMEWQGVDGNVLPGATSLLAGLREVAPQAQIEYEPGAHFATGTRAAICIAFVGEKPYAEGWGDNPEPTLSPSDLAVLERMRGACDELVVVLVTGRPLFITDHIDDWDALAVAWLPGSEGAGVADVLFGAVPTSATLPLPWPRTVGSLPFSLAGTGADGIGPLFPRGAGIPIGEPVRPAPALVE